MLLRAGFTEIGTDIGFAPGLGKEVVERLFRLDGQRYPRPMFDALSDKLQSALGDLRGRGVIDEEALSRAMREVRLALLEADVNLGVVRDFVAHVRERALGEDVRKSLTPGQQVVKIVHDELTELLGSEDSKLAFAPKPPTTILLAGLQGSGKTTTAAKLARLLREEGKKPALVAADLQRPAAIEQLRQLGAELDVPVYADERADPVKAVRDGIARATADGRDLVILDTAGRLQIDEALMDELAAVRDEAKPTNVLLVLDAMTGQEAVNVATAFQERIDFDGVILTKLDGDARGGAALSVRCVTGRPIKLASTARSSTTSTGSTPTAWRRGSSAWATSSRSSSAPRRRSPRTRRKSSSAA